MKRGIIAAAVLSCASASLAENIIAEVDVVVAGGTSYGVAAAVEAARCGYALSPSAVPAIDGYAVDSTWIGAGNVERSECLREILSEPRR